MVGLAEVMEALYDSEIASSVSCLWDGGWDLQLGDPVNGFDAMASCEAGKLNTEGARWLAQKAIVLHPQSNFANAGYAKLLMKDPNLAKPVELHEIFPLEPSSRAAEYAVQAKTPPPR